VWDADGREFIDYRNGLGPVTLGYRFPAVDEAIRRQLERGIVFGHPTAVECEAAELVCELVPCAEQARFLKTGGEAIAAAIRIARACTGRDHIVQIGYNGWVNTLAAGASALPGGPVTTLPGVPAAVSALHHAAGWDDIPGLTAVLDEFDGQVAAVVVAADYARMAAGREFYPQLRELTRRRGVLLVHDEIVTGFRLAVGGAGEHFGITPDLAVFSKGMANGMPVSVYAGSRDVMSACAPGKAVVSSTFGGETLSLAAAIACMTTYRDCGVVEHLWRQGERLWTGVGQLFTAASLPLTVRGLWPCPSIGAASGADAVVVPAFLRAAYRHGVSLYTVSYVNFSHHDDDIDETLRRLEKACADVAATLP